MDTTGIVLTTSAAGGAGVHAAGQHVANRPIVWHVLRSLRSAGAEESFVIGPKAELDAIKDVMAAEDPVGSDITYLPADAMSGLAGMLTAAAPFVGDASCIVHTADGLLGQPLAPLTDLLRPSHPDLVLLLNSGAPGPAPKDEQLLRQIGEITGFRSPSALAGACLFGPGAINLTCGGDQASETDTSLSWLAERVAAEGGRVQAGPVSWQRYCGHPAELLEMNRMVLDQLPDTGPPAVRSGNRIEGRVLIHPTAEVRSTVIAGPAIIGAGAVIDNAYIGPYTSIGRDAEIQGSEISRSIVLERARVLHIRERIEASTIGRGVVVRTDFSLPRAMRLHVADGDELTLN